MAISEKMIRLLKIVTLLEQKNGASLHSLIAECGVCERTIYRDIEAISLSGMPVFFDTNTRRYQFTQKVFLHPLTFSVDEATVVIQCIQAFSQEKSPLTHSLCMAQEKILATLPSERQKKVDEWKRAIDIKVAGKIPDICDNIFSCIEKAVHEKRSVWVHYFTKYSETLTERKLDPYVITFRGRAWYLVAYCHLRGAVKIFRLDRIKEAIVLAERWELPRNFSASAFFEGSWLIEQGDPLKVRLKFFPEAARWIKDTAFHPTQKLQELYDGTVIFDVTVNGTREITQWILGFGDAVEVLKPLSLRESISDTIQKMQKNYKS